MKFAVPYLRKNAVPVGLLFHSSMGARGRKISSKKFQ